MDMPTLTNSGLYDGVSVSCFTTETCHGVKQHICTTSGVSDTTMIEVLINTIHSSYLWPNHYTFI